MSLREQKTKPLDAVFGESVAGEDARGEEVIYVSA